MCAQRIMLVVLSCFHVFPLHTGSARTKVDNDAATRMDRSDQARYCGFVSCSSASDHRVIPRKDHAKSNMEASQNNRGMVVPPTPSALVL